MSVGLETTSKARNIKERKKERRKETIVVNVWHVVKTSQKEEMTYDKPDVQILS